MFNLQEKKAWIQDLATQLILTSDDENDEGALPNQPLQYSVEEDGMQLKLEDLALFKMNTFRMLFLSKIIQLHAASGTGQIALNSNQFYLITDIIRVILREGNNEADFAVIRMVYQAAGLFGLYIGRHIKTVRVRFASSPPQPLSLH